jgi:3'-5' exoribonuclease
MHFIEDLRDGDHIIEHYLCKQKHILKSHSGKTYFSLQLSDRTGTIDAKVWDMTNEVQAFEEGEFIKIDGAVLTYQNALQIKIARIRRSDAGEYEPADYIRRTDKDINALYSQILGYIDSISDPFIKKLMDNILVSNVEVSTAFKLHSAAKSLHHNYMGGLLEHTLNVADICAFLAPRYRHANRDILISTAILHDIGKIYELSPMPASDYTDDGQMIGHIVIGAEMVTAEAGKIPGFPHQLLSLIKHSILAHHGEYEFGSPKLPGTIEAFILHCADNLDAKAKAYEEAVDQKKTPGNWAGYQRMLERHVRNSEFGG